MLRYFFEKPLAIEPGQDTSQLFINTAIWQDEKYRALQGQFPVISLTLKDVKEPNWQKTYEKITSLIAEEFKRYEQFIESHKDKIGQNNFELFQQLASKQASQTEV